MQKEEEAQDQEKAAATILEKDIPGSTASSCIKRCIIDRRSLVGQIVRDMLRSR